MKMYRIEDYVNLENPTPGVPAHTAIGTDRFAIFGGVLVGLYKFHEKGLIRYRVGITVGIPVLIGSALGARLALEFSEELLKLAIIVINLLAMDLFVVRPQLGLERVGRKQGPGNAALGVIICLALGVYGGFYGAMAGTLTVYCFHPLVRAYLPGMRGNHQIKRPGAKFFRCRDVRIKRCG